MPNATVGMIIGKGGSYVKQIKDETKAFVQISQKSADTLLVERVVTIAGQSSLPGVLCVLLLHTQFLLNSPTFLKLMDGLNILADGSFLSVDNGHEINII